MRQRRRTYCFHSYNYQSDAQLSERATGQSSSTRCWTLTGSRRTSTTTIANKRNKSSHGNGTVTVGKRSSQRHTNHTSGSGGEQTPMQPDVSAPIRVVLPTGRDVRKRTTLVITAHVTGLRQAHTGAQLDGRAQRLAADEATVALRQEARRRRTWASARPARDGTVSKANATIGSQRQPKI
jgi:hypothetical protein